jgi:hypothetical protein
MLPIPTGLGWLLLQSVFGGKPLEQMAKFAAEGAALSGDDEGTAFERFRKVLRRLVKGHKAQPASEAAILEAIMAGSQNALKNAFPPDRASQLFDRLRNATGPFAALAFIAGPQTPTPASQALLEFSEDMDRLGAAFDDAVKKDDFAGARDVLLGAERFDPAYWELPEDGMPHAEVNRVILRGANNWDQLTRAATPVIKNVTMSWLSLLDIATLSAGRYHGADFSLFQPLITRPTEITAMADIQQADRQKLPVANLVRMVEAIAEDINAKQRARLRPSERNIRNKGDELPHRDALKAVRKHDVLSLDQFTALVMHLRPDTKPKGDDRCGFDIYSLLMATNLFSLLTPRDGKPPLGKSRRPAPETIICLPGIEAGYARGWKSNHGKVAGSTAEHSWPVWLSRL